MSRKVSLTESTRARIGMMLPDGKIKSIYCHWDGHPDEYGVGGILQKYYKSKEKIKKLLDLGDISILDKEIGQKQDFNKRKKGWTLAYGRDRGETGTEAEISKNIEDFLNQTKENGGEYAYLYQDGKWYVYDMWEKNWLWGTPEGVSENKNFKKGGLQEMLTKQDFQELVRIVLFVRKEFGSKVADYVEKHLLDFCYKQNPNFDETKWNAFKEKIKTQLGIKESKMHRSLAEAENSGIQSCGNCAYYDETRNWCKNATYVIASAGGFLLYTWLANPTETNKCPVFKVKE